jgi:hypothetical protein
VLPKAAPRQREPASEPVPWPLRLVNEKSIPSSLIHAPARAQIRIHLQFWKAFSHAKDLLVTNARLNYVQIPQRPVLHRPFDEVVPYRCTPKAERTEALHAIK